MVEKITVNVRFLGGAMEVGRSAVIVEANQKRVLIDYGVMVDHEPGFPMHIPSKEVDAIIATHSHLDHSGAIPIFHIRGKIPVYGTQLTLELARLLISDFIHLTGYYLPFEYLDLQNMMDCSVRAEYKETKDIGGVKFELLNSGHLPGGAQALLHTEGKNILYTSDFNITPTRLLSGADLSYGEIDAIIIESTYADEDHPDRIELEKQFMKRIIGVVDRGGTVLVPAFGVGRSQEILCILASYHFEYPVTIDGMTMEANEVLMRHSQYLRDPKLFMDAIHMANWVHGWKDRRKAAKKSGVIIAPAGMLQGGSAVFYMQKLAKEKNNAVFLVSYQVPGTPGRELLAKREFIIGGKSRGVEAEVEHFNFSSHAGRQQLHETVKQLKGNPIVFVMHGAEDNCQLLAKWIEDETSLKAVVPKVGESFKI